MSRIARQDYPVQWYVGPSICILTPLILASRPDLVSHLAGVINSSVEARFTNSASNASLLLRRSLEVLNAILKEYAAFKMLTGVKTMGKVCERGSYLYFESC